MSDNLLPIWRQALKDTSHPLYKATWLIFGQNTKAEAAVQILADQKEQVIPYLYQILDAEELYLESALGGGNAPIHAVELLGEWQVMEAVPRLVKIIEADDWDSIIHSKTLMALEKMGSDLIPTMIDLGQRAERGEISRDAMIASVGTLSEIGKGDPDAYNWVLHVFDTTPDDHHEFISELLLKMNRAQAITDLELRLKKRKFSKFARQRIEKNVKDAKAGNF